MKKISDIHRNTSRKSKWQRQREKWDAGTIKRLFLILKGYRWEAALALGSAIIASLIQLLTPIWVGKGIDQIVGKGQVHFPILAQLCVVLLIAYGSSGILQWMVALLSNRLAQRTIEDLRGQAFAKLSRLPLQYYDTKAHGDILSRLTNDIDAVADGLQQTILQMLMGVVVVTGTMVVMLVFNSFIALGIMGITFFAVLLARFIAKRSSKMFQKQSQAVGTLNGLAEEMIAGHREVLLYGAADQVFGEFEEKNQLLYRVGQAAQFYSSLVNPTTRFVNNIAYVLTGVWTGLLAISGSMSIGQMATMLNLAIQFARPINEVSSVSTQLQAAIASAKRIFELIDEQAEEFEEGSKPTLRTAKGDVTFSHVDFSYAKQKPLIQDLSFEVKKGQTLAIVGSSGAGKTTIVNLLMRFYEVDQGEIQIDGENAASVTRNSVRENFAMVLQDSWLFAGSVRENIAYGLPNASEKEIVEAAKAAHADGFIRRMPKRYDTQIEENGRNLSQGERQLLTVARALLLKPPMLILDEATSSVDTRTEMAIRKAFGQAMQGRTSVVIAHRLSTIEDADLILVLDAGRIVEQGAHLELLAAHGFYRKLHDSQFIQN